MQLQALEGLLKDQKREEEQYLAKLAHSEIAFEQARYLLGKVQLETSVLANNLEDTRNKDENLYKQSLKELADKVWIIFRSWQLHQIILLYQ